MTHSEESLPVCPDDDIRRTANISPCGRYRYSLARWWGRPARTCAWFVMLNPSTADAMTDDPTIRRCMGFGRSWGFDGVEIHNLYALRATDPRELWTADNPVGEGIINDEMLGLAAGNAAHFGEPLIAAWGVNARADRVERAIEIAAEYGAQFQSLGVTKDGHPRHPLYLPRTAELRPWPTKEAACA